MHQMGGFDAPRLKEELLPEGFEPGTMAVIGYPGDLDQLPEKHLESETAPRSRKALSEIAFGARWGEPASFI
jgi:hypothetical protein